MKTIPDCSCFANNQVGHAYLNQCAQSLGAWVDEVLDNFPICDEAKPYVLANLILTIAFQPEIERAAREQNPSLENFRKCWEDVVARMPEVLEQRLAIAEQSYLNAKVRQ